MTDSWKIGAVAGLTAGIIGGIMSLFLGIYIIENGLVFWGLEKLSTTPKKELAIVEIPLCIIWGIVLGIIYSKVYDVIPRKGITKGVIFGLIYYFIYGIRWATFNLMYGFSIIAFSWLHFIVIFIPLGLALGISYEFLSKRFVAGKEQIATIKNNLKGAFYPGAIAGLLSGATSFLAAWIIINPLLWHRFATDVGFLLSELGTLVMFDMIWGIIFGILFAMFYEKIPKSGILKGLIFAMAVFFFTNFQNFIRPLIYIQILPIEYSNIIWAFWGLLAGLSVFVPFGIVLGLLYRKSGD